MALVKCRECGQMISDKAESCPNCGCPIKKAIKKKCSYKPNRRVFGTIIVILLLIGGICIYWSSRTMKYVLEHQKINGTVLKNINGLLYTVANCENENTHIADEVLSDCKAVGYYKGKDSLKHISQFMRGEVVSLYNNENRLLCEYVLNDDDELTDFKAYGSFFEMETDKCLLTFKGKEAVYDDVGLQFEGSLKKYVVNGESHFTELDYSKSGSIEEYALYYPNRNVKKHKVTDGKNVLIDEYFKKDGTEYTLLEQILSDSKTKSCVFKTDLHREGNPNDKLYMLMYANADDVSKGFVVYVHSDDDMRSCVFDYFYQYEIMSSQLILSQGGRIKNWVAFFRQYKLKTDSRKLVILIDGETLNGDAPQFNGSTTYEYVKNRQAFQKLRQLEQFKHMDIIQLQR